MDRLDSVIGNNKTRHFSEREQSVTEEVASGEQVNYRFVPAYLDTETNQVHLSKYADGELAAVHVFDHLPDQLLERDPLNHQIIGVNPRVQIGYVLKDQFYLQEDVIAMIQMDAKQARDD